MIDDIVTGVIGGVIGEKLVGKWMRRHRYITLIICVPILAAIAYFALDQLLQS